MTINSELTSISTTASNIKTEITNKGQTVSSSDTWADLPAKIKQIENYGHHITVKEVIDGSVENIEDDTLKYIRPNCFRGCINLETAKFSTISKICRLAFCGCHKLKALILSGSTMVKLDSIDAFRYTMIEAGTGNIYVTDSLVNTYKAADNWKFYASYIKPLSDYTGGGIIDNSLQIWYPLFGTTTNRGKATASLSGTPTWGSGYLCSTALNLGSRLTATCSALNGLQEWTVAFWCIVNSSTTLTGDWWDIVCLYDQKSDNTTNGTFRFETCYNYNVGVGYYNNGTLATITVNGGTIIEGKDQWHHVAASIAKSGVKIYVDGKVVATRVHAGGHLTGTFYMGETGKISGQLQDLRIYNRALNNTEIYNLSQVR